MQEYNVIGGKQGVRIKFFIEDTRYDDGRGLDAIAYNESGLSVYYTLRDDDTATQISPVLRAGTGYQANAWAEIDATNMPGTYELHLPNACVALNFGQCDITVLGATNMAQTHLRVTDVRDLRSGYCRFDPSQHA